MTRQEVDRVLSPERLSGIAAVTESISVVPPELRVDEE
jgi:hypothetical protein